MILIVEKIKSFLKDLDYYVLIPTLGLCLLGLVSIFSATYTDAEDINFTKQISFFGIGIVLMLAVILIPIRLIDSASLTFYAIMLVLLIFVLLFGPVRYGAKRWIALGPLSLQPSELAKVATILTVARMLALQRINASSLYNIILSIALVSVPMFLVFREPDLGTALCIGCVALPMLFWHGISWFSIFVMFSPLVTVLIHIGSGYNFDFFIATLFLILVVLYFSKRSAKMILVVLMINVVVGLGSEPLWDSLKDYQKERILTFLDPERDAKGAGYQVLQSQIAIGSGGLLGKGYLEGSQTQLHFMPEQHTDFIFSALAEEFGFAGSVILLALFAILIVRIIMIADVVDDKFSSLTLIGIASLFTFQVLVNIGMTTGIMPVTGIPLPFLSYGGTALLTNLLLVGIVLNIAMRKKVYDIH